MNNLSLANIDLPSSSGLGVAVAALEGAQMRIWNGVIHHAVIHAAVRAGQSHGYTRVRWQHDSDWDIESYWRYYYMYLLD